LAGDIRARANRRHMRLDVGCGQKKRPGFIGIDVVAGEGVDIVHDLTALPWPIEDNAAEEIVLDNVIEHLPDTVKTFDELHRIARPGCRVEMIYPYWRSFGAYSDPTHVHFFNEYMIEYFRRPGSSTRSENRYAFYTRRYWKLINRDLVTYPFLAWIPNRVLSFGSRHFVDIVHAVRLVIEPEK
jgi:SAM-dependent methyltransferase